MPDPLQTVKQVDRVDLWSAPWAIVPECATQVAAALNAISAGEVVASEEPVTDGKVGIIKVFGPIVPAGSLAEMVGYPSTATLSADFAAMEKNPKIETILMVYDSPGGVVTGLSEFGAQVKASQKRTVSYVYGTAASAAYWLATSADEMYSADTGMTGSIGVVVTMDVDSDTNRVTITNSQSPNKRVDPTSEGGRAEVVQMLDQLADVFINTVAENRGVSKDIVMSKFGKGGMLGAQKAQSVGMIDGIKTLASLQAELSTGIEAISVPKAVDASTENMYNESDESETTMSEETKMANLSELVAGDASLQAEMTAAQSEAKAAGKKNAEAIYAKRLEVARPVLTADYPESFKAMALQVIAGEKDPAVLEGALMAYDAMKAEKEGKAAIADSEEIEATVAMNPETAQLSDDGVLRSTADIDAEIAELKEWR